MYASSSHLMGLKQSYEQTDWLYLKILCGNWLLRTTVKYELLKFSQRTGLDKRTLASFVENIHTKPTTDKGTRANVFLHHRQIWEHIREQNKTIVTLPLTSLPQISSGLHSTRMIKYCILFTQTLKIFISET